MVPKHLLLSILMHLLWVITIVAQKN